MQDASPRTSLRALDQRRSELNSQLTSLTIRRDLLSQQLRNSDAAGQQQIRAMLADVGNQTAAVMKDMAATDAAANKLTAELSNAPVDGIRGQVSGTGIATVPPRVDMADRITAVGAIAVIAILAISLLNFFRRSRPVAAQLGVADVSRIEKLQQSIDVIAVEVERIAEGQRHLSKVLADRALGAGGADGLPVGQADRVSTRAR